MKPREAPRHGLELVPVKLWLSRKGNEMNNDVLEGKWKQIKGEIKTQWGRLTNDEIDQIQGKRDKLIGKVQEKYGRSRAEAEREVDRFLSKLETV